MNGVLVHVVFESLAYAAGFALFRRLRRTHGHPTDGHPSGGFVLVGAVLGAAAGSKCLDLLQYASWTRSHLGDLGWMLGGKTIVGGLLGGWAGVEMAKRAAGITRSTGDLLVLPLIVGMAIGRVGCLLAGPGDHTDGFLTSAAWAVDRGDGPRHPALLLELVALAGLAVVARLPSPRDGDRFLRFMAGYLLFRFLVDFLKAPYGPDTVLPVPDLLFGVTAIQAFALAGAAYAGSRLVRRSGAPARATFPSSRSPA